MDIPGPLPYVGNPPLSFRFGVLFFTGGSKPNPLDILFQKVSGIGGTVEMDSTQKGGQNSDWLQLAKRVRYDNLVLERGLVVGSPLSKEFDAVMSDFKFRPSNILVTLLDNTRLPLASWLFMKAYPVKWSLSDLDANANTVIIETMELTYQRMQIIRL